MIRFLIIFTLIIRSQNINGCTFSHPYPTYFDLLNLFLLKAINIRTFKLFQKALIRIRDISIVDLDLSYLFAPNFTISSSMYKYQQYILL